MTHKPPMTPTPPTQHAAPTRHPPPATSTPQLILLPGLDGTGKLFTRFIQALGADIDARIIGYPLDEPMGYEELEARVRRALPIDKPYLLLAESFGGPLAIRIAADPPEGLRGIVLSASFCKNPYPLFGWASPLAGLVPIKALPRWIRAPLMWGSTDSTRAPKRADRAIADVEPRVITRRIAALLTVDASDSLKRVAIPIRIVQALHDRVIPKAATRKMLAQNPAARIIPVDGPHLLLQSRPDACVTIVRDFLRDLMTAQDVLAAQADANAQAVPTAQCS